MAPKNHREMCGTTTATRRVDPPDRRDASGETVGQVLGHRRIAMIAAIDPKETRWPAVPFRSQAYHSALRDAGIAADPSLATTVDWGGLQGAEAMGELLSLREPPTAVYAHSDEVALGALRTLRRAGIRVPEDISVIGIDDHPLAELTDLTTVGQPVRQQGVLAGQMVLGLLQGEDVDRAVTVPTRLVIRRSTAPPRAIRAAAPGGQGGRGFSS